jgi:hypothetical protein
MQSVRHMSVFVPWRVVPLNIYREHSRRKEGCNTNLTSTVDCLISCMCVARNFPEEPVVGPYGKNSARE